MIIEMKESQFVNDYGIIEKYVQAEISMRLSGHCNAGSVYYSDWDCGNCDGGRCDTCTEIYTVTIYRRPVLCDEGYRVTKICKYRNCTDLDAAKAYLKENTEDMI